MACGVCGEECGMWMRLAGLRARVNLPRIGRGVALVTYDEIFRLTSHRLHLHIYYLTNMLYYKPTAVMLNRESAWPITIMVGLLGNKCTVSLISAYIDPMNTTSSLQTIDASLTTCPLQTSPLQSILHHAHTSDNTITASNMMMRFFTSH